MEESDVSIRQEQPMSSDALVRTPMSFEDYLALPEGDRAEYVDGVCIRMSASPMARHQRIAWRLANAIDDGVPGLFVVEAVGVWTAARRSRIPDIVVTESPFDGPWSDQTPLLVVEVLSPATRTEDTFRKSREYGDAGIGQYWIVDHENRKLTVLANNGDGWDVAVELDAEHPTGEVALAGHGTVALDLDALLAV